MSSGVCGGVARARPPRLLMGCRLGHITTSRCRGGVKCTFMLMDYYDDKYLQELFKISFPPCIRDSSSASAHMSRAFPTCTLFWRMQCAVRHLSGQDSPLQPKVLSVWSLKRIPRAGWSIHIIAIFYVCMPVYECRNAMTGVIPTHPGKCLSQS